MTRRRPRARSGLAVAGLFAALVLTLWASYLSKAVCDESRSDFMAFTNYCYSDVLVFWTVRDLEVDAYPYRDPGDWPAGLEGERLSPPPDVVEYPPLTGIGMWVVALATSTLPGFFALTAATLAVATLLGFELLRRLVDRERLPRWRLLGFALSPGLVAVGMQNWDLWLLPFVLGGLLAATSERRHLAAALFAVGASLKWWPAILVLLLLVGPWARTRSVTTRLAPAATAAGTWVAIQLPFWLHNARAWFAVLEFHLSRSPNLDSFFGAVEELTRRTLDPALADLVAGPVSSVATLSVLLAGVGAVVAAVERRRLSPLAGAASMVVVFLLTSKVFSPQYIVWLVPLLVATRVRWTPVLAVEGLNLLVWFTRALHIGGANQMPAMLWASQLFAVLRSAALVWVLVDLVVRDVPPTPDSGQRPLQSEAVTADGVQNEPSPAA